MKRTIGMWVAGLVLACGAAQAGDLKIATVDGNRLLKGYYKTGLADRHMQEQYEDFRAERDKLIAEHKKLKQQFESLRAEADNKALTDEARDKKKEQAEERLTQVIESENTINDKAASRKKQLEDEGRKIQTELAKSIQAAVKAVAAKDGYTLVLESSGLLANGLEPVLYADPKTDITDAVMTILNADKPAAKE